MSDLTETIVRIKRRYHTTTTTQLARLLGCTPAFVGQTLAAAGVADTDAHAVSVHLDTVIQMVVTPWQIDNHGCRWREVYSAR